MTCFRRLFVPLLERLFSPVRVPDVLREWVASKSDIILLTPSRSFLVEALLRSLVRRAGFDTLIHIAHSCTAESGTTAHPPKTVRWASLSDLELLAQTVAQHPAQEFSTFNIFHVRGPVRNPPQSQPGLWWHVTLLPARRIMYVTFGTPFRFPVAHPVRILRRVKVDFYRNLKLVRGTPLQPIETQERIVLSGQEFERELRILAERSGESLGRMRRAATRSFREMAANPRRPWYVVVAVCARLIIDKLFVEVIVRGVDKLIPAIKEHPVVLVPMHRSHLDYILVGHRLFESKINPPLVAAGVNLRFWPVGYLIRSVGGYFVKRNARDRLHSVLLKRYTMYLIKRGHLLEFFIEGGRSRSGRMLQPKLGLLGILLEAYLRGVRKEILVVPVSITYENLIEEDVFGDENTGRSKSKENIFSLLRALDVFRKKYGEAIVSFGEPIALSRFIARYAQQNGTHSGVKRRSSDERFLTQELGLTLTQAIRNQINPSLTALAYTALMTSPNYGLVREELVEQVKQLAHYLVALKKAHYPVGEFTPALERFLTGREHILGDLTRGGVVQVGPHLDTQVYFISGSRRFTADFYKNSTIHLFFHLGLLSILHLLGRDLSAGSAGELHALFEYDFILSRRSEFEREISSVCTVLLQEATIVEREGKTIFADTRSGCFMPSLLASFIQSLLWILFNLQKQVHHRDEEEVTSKEGVVSLSYPSFMERLQKEFRTAMYLGIMKRTEAASRANLLAALDSLSARQIVTIQERRGQRYRIMVKQDCSADFALLQEMNRAILEWEQSRAAQLSSQPQLI